VEAEGGREGGRERDRERGRKGERGAGSMLLYIIYTKII
jgi:hypothetical protein